MARKLRTRLSLETLESRDIPSALIQFFTSGNLTIRGDNTPNNVVILEGAPGSFAVSVNGVPQATFPVRSITLNMGSGNDTVDIGVATNLTGGIIANLGGGNDSFTTKNSTLNARVAGNVTVNVGTSSASFGNYDETVELYNLVFAGNYVTANGAGGPGTQELDLQSTRIAGTLTARNFYVVQMGLPGDATGAVTIATLIVDNGYKNTDGRADGPNGGGNAVFMYSGSKVSGNFIYYGGAGRDDLDLPADFPGPVANVSIGGNLTVYGRTGVNTLSLGFGGFGARVGGNVNFVGSNGIDRFFFDNGSSVGGNVTLSLYGGDDQVFGDSLGLGAGPYDPTGTATVGGSLTVWAGTGHNFIGTYAGPGTNLSVGGSILIHLGWNGNFGGAAAAPGVITFFNDNVTIGGTATIISSGGPNTIDITNAGIANLVMLLGGGASTVNFSIPAFYGNLYLDFGWSYLPKGFETDPIPTAFVGRKVVLNGP